MNANGSATGTYKITTEHGTYYLVDFDSKKFKRVRAQGRNPLKRDGEWIPFISVSEILIGDGMHFIMPPTSASGGDTWRQTTQVSSIEKVETDDRV